jgi:phospholipid/cholesterol/gamma-HCH transport system substrate-binding protein
MSRSTRPIHLRYVNEAVGAFVLLVGAIIVVVLFQSARLQHWFDPGKRLQVVLPQEGLYGLSAGSEVHVLGTLAGAVEQIVIDSDDGTIYAEVRIRPQFTSFIRSDSVATIRRKLAVAGDAFLEISRGTGKPLDWDLAVIQATVDTAPSDALNALLTKLEEKAVPAFDHIDEAVVEMRDLLRAANDPQGDLKQLLARTASVSAKIDSGGGTIGRLIEDDQLLDDVQAIAARLRTTLDRIDPMIQTLDRTMNDLAEITGNIRQRSGEIPQIIQQTNQSLERLQTILADLQRVSDDFPDIAENVSDVSQALPGLVIQARQTLRQIEKLSAQAQQSWLLGGSGRDEPTSRRITPAEAQP